MKIAILFGRSTAAMAFVVATFAGGTASAETIAVSSLVPAKDANAASAGSVAVDRFDGTDGSAMSYAIEKELQNAMVDGRPYFQIFAGNSRAEAILSGTARGSVDEFREFQLRTNCLKYDERKACIESEELEITCIKKVASINSTVRLASRAGGRVLYSSNKAERSEQISCPDQSRSETSESMIQSLITEVAKDVRNDMAPSQWRMNIALQERRSGIPKQHRDTFKAAVKLSKRDETASCTAFTALYEQAPQARSVIYNTALCAERAGDYAKAAQLFRVAQPMYRISSSADVGLRRVASSAEARRQINARR